MTRLTALPRLKCMLGTLFVVLVIPALAQAAEEMGAHTGSGALSSHDGGAADRGGAPLGPGPRVINPGDAGGYKSDATIHRTGDGERTNVDGSEFETDLEGTSNTTFPGD